MPFDEASFNLSHGRAGHEICNTSVSALGVKCHFELAAVVPTDCTDAGSSFRHTTWLELARAEPHLLKVTCVGGTLRGASALCSQPCFYSVKIQREEADTSVRYVKVAVSGMSARLEG
jgi:hypothetical protein